ncbi:LuxR C-terminal-related transcriptional regulator [Micromonospora sp. NPDC003197]
MPHAPSDVTGQPSANSQPRHSLSEEATRLLATPGLVVIHGGPGCGRSTLLRQLATTFRGPVFHGGALATLRSVPAFALTHALRVRLPEHDPPLLAEAVRSRVRDGLLLLDDVQWADPATLATLVPLARHCRVAVTLRTPHRLPPPVETALRTAAAGWLAVPALDPAAATELAHATAPDLTPAALTDVVTRAGGLPLAVQALARHATTHPTPVDPTGGHDLTQVEYAVATALADLTRPARTAMAALGLLGHPAPTGLLGVGIPELTRAGLVNTDPAGTVGPVSPYVAEVAAGLLDEPNRRALHRRLAELVPPAEAARHLAAAGDGPAAYQHALAAADTPGISGGERAELLLFACQLPDVTPAPQVRLAAAQAALDSGRPRAAAQLLAATPTGDLNGDPAVTVLHAEALLHLGDPTAARTTADAVPDDAAADVVATRDRIRLLAQLADDPTAAAATAAQITARTGPPPTHAGLRAALAAVAAHTRAPRWEDALASAATDSAAAGQLLTSRWSAWLLVETLAADGRLSEATQTARSAGHACAADHAYSWQTRFLAAELWCTALRGDRTGSGTADETLRRAVDLTDRTVPPLAHGYAAAAASLIEADAGLLAPARARLAGATDVPLPAAGVLDWVDREAAWLDGQPERAATEVEPPTGPPLIDGLRRITARWAAYDGGPVAFDRVGTGSAVPPVGQTLTAWHTLDADRFAQAADGWHDLAVREQVRCLLAAGLHQSDPARAVPPLLAAERMAEEAGLVVLLGRTRRALRRHAVRRDGRGPRTDGALTMRERDVLHLVAAGEPSRRIAGQLGISAETVETHIRAGMRKLGARTRTEAAALVLAGGAPRENRVPGQWQVVQP